jgi:hypothetical protein
MVVDVCEVCGIGAILKPIKDLENKAAVNDMGTIAVLGKIVAEQFRGPGLAPVVDRPWPADVRRRHKEDHKGSAVIFINVQSR